jgi:hypothetical protein
MNTVRLGRSGLEVSRIAFGTWELGGDWGGYDEQAAIEAIRFARERGVNLFDTAQAYGFGESERTLGKALRDDIRSRRDEIVIATKGGLRIDEARGVVRDSSPMWLREGVTRSAKELGVDYIDLYQLHWPDPNTPFEESGQALQDMVDEGLIRHVGVSNFNPAQIDELSRTRPVETLQPPYSMFRRGIEADILPYCREHELGVLVYGVLAHGLLTGAMSPDQSFEASDWRAGNPEFRGEGFRRNLGLVDRLSEFARERGWTISQLAIAWALANPAVDVAIVGARSRKHIDESLRAVDLRLSEDDLAEIDEILEAAVQLVGPSPEARKL